MRRALVRAVVLLGFLGLALPLAQPAEAGVIGFGPAFTDDASTGISTLKAYTHTVSGGEAVSVNGVGFDLLNSNTTPPNFAWDAQGKNRNELTNNNGDWKPALGGVTGPEIQGLLNDFTYSSNGDVAGSHQSFSLSGLSPGTAYESRLYIRVWDTEGSGRPIDFTFTNGSETDTVSILGDRPANQGYPSNHSAYYLAYAYTAQGTTMTIDAAVPPNASGKSGSLHHYAMSNEVVEGLPRVAIPGLFNTGVDNSGVPLPNDLDEIDPHYQIIVNPNGTGLGAHVEDETVFPIDGPWLDNSSTSKWIAPEFNTSGATAGDYVYEMLFDLGGLIPETASISGLWASDNAGLEILLNDVLVTSAGNAQFDDLIPFSIPIGGPFIEGMNTLAFRLNNATTGYTALRVEGLEGSAVRIPEPTTLALLGLGGLLSLARRRRRSA